LQPWLGLGVDPKDLSILQLLLRAFVIFFVALALVRIANKRFLARRSAFDYVLGIILAAALARAVNGSAPFFGTIVQTLCLVLLHRLLAAFSYRYVEFGNWVKGKEETLVEDGQIIQTTMSRNHISRKDLEEDVRLCGGENLGEVKTARIERNGEISVLRKPEVIPIKVEDGVQTVEIRVKS